jgi:hypothetical protein
MNNAPAMRFFKRLSEFVGNFDDLAKRQQFVAGQRLQRVAFDVLHDDKRAAVSLSDLMDFADEWMVECGCCQRLTPEPFTGNLIALAVSVQKLDRDAAFETRIFGKRDLSHTTSAKRGENPVAARE